MTEKKIEKNNNEEVKKENNIEKESVKKEKEEKENKKEIKRIWEKEKIIMELPKELYDIYMIYFKQFKNEKENQWLTDEEIHWKIFLSIFYDSILNKLR